MTNEELLLAMMPYARSAARRVRFKFGIEEDDTFQYILLDCWLKIDQAATMENPILWLRRNMRFSISDVLQDRFRNKKNSMMQQMPVFVDDDGSVLEMEVPAPQRDCDVLLMDKVARSLHAKGPKVVKSFHDVHLLGLSRKEVAVDMGISVTRVDQHLGVAVEAVCAVTGVPPEQRLMRPQRDTNVYTLKHADGREITGDRKTLMGESGLPSGSLGSLLVGRRKHYSGWRVAC